MQHLPMNRLHYLEGEISHCRPVHGFLHLSVGGREVSLIESNVAGKFRNGDVLRILARDISGGAVFKVVAWQRYGHRRVHYAGLRATVQAVLVGGALLAAGIALQNPWLATAGGATLMVQLLFAARRAWILRSFDNVSRWPAAEPQPAAESAPEPPETPLELPLNSTPSLAAASAGNWPAEILEFTHDAIIIWEMEGSGILYWNRAAEQLYGYSREEAHGRVTHELLKTEIAGGVSELESRLARYGLWVGTLCHTGSDGRRIEVEGRLSLMSQEHRPWLVLEVNRDVTDRNRAEDARRALEQQLSRLRELTRQ